MEHISSNRAHLKHPNTTTTRCRLCHCIRVKGVNFFSLYHTCFSHSLFGRLYSLPAESLRETAASLHIKVPAKEEKDYLYLLTALDATAQELLSLPDYDPNATDTTIFPRTDVHRPSTAENPCNGWSHKFSLKAQPPIRDGILSGRTVVVKDNVGVATIPSALGTDVITGYTPTMDATVVTRVVSAGGHVVGTAGRSSA